MPVKLSQNPKVTAFCKVFKAKNNPDSRFFQADEDVLLNNERYVQGKLGAMFQELDEQISISEIRKATLSLNNGKGGA